MVVFVFVVVVVIAVAVAVAVVVVVVVVVGAFKKYTLNADWRWQIKISDLFLRHHDTKLTFQQGPN